MTDDTSRAIDCWRAHRIRRWHANIRLADRHQNLADHAWGVAALILQLHPRPSSALIGYALLHDAGEHATGDVPWPAKAANPALRDALKAAEAKAAAKMLPDWLASLELKAEDRQWISLADKLEAILWAAHQGVDVVTAPDWGEQVRATRKAAQQLGALHRVNAIIQEATA